MADHNDDETARLLKNSTADSPTSSWSATKTIKRYGRSQSVADANPDDYSKSDVLRIRERLIRIHSRTVGATSSFTYMSRSQKFTLISLSIADFMSFCSMSIMAPFFPREAELKGMSNSMSGMVFSFYAVVMFLTSPIFGKMLPRIGAKVLFTSGILIAGVTNILFGLLVYVNDYVTFTSLCLIIRGLEALGVAAFSTASYVFVVKTFPNSITSVLGILETFIGLGMSVGPAIGGYLYSIGGFGLPFYVLGFLMVVLIPINLILLPSVENFAVNKSGSLLNLLSIPSVIITVLTIVVVSNIWGFLDPTLEPHLRQFNLSTEQVGLVFLMFSSLYGLSSPIWGIVADRVDNHWSMMSWGLLFCSFGLLLLGPSPFFTFLESSVWLDMIALSILGVSVALALLPTFQNILQNAIEEGCGDTLETCSMVAGLWSCTYSLGEVIGPSAGGIFLDHIGFAGGTTIQAIVAFVLATVIFIFFSVRDRYVRKETTSDSGISESWEVSTTSSGSQTPDKSNYYSFGNTFNTLSSSNLKSNHSEYYQQFQFTARGACEI